MIQENKLQENKLSELQKMLFELEYDKLVAGTIKGVVRTIKYNFKTPCDVGTYTGDSEAALKLFRNYPYKAAKVYDFIEKVRETYSGILGMSDEECAQKYCAQLDVSDKRTADEAVITEPLKIYSNKPMTALYEYLSQSTDRYCNIIRAYYGINPTNLKLSVREISAKVGKRVESIRHIIRQYRTCQLRLSPDFRSSVAEARNSSVCRFVKDKDIVSHKDLVGYINEEGLPANDFTFLSLCRVALPEYELFAHSPKSTVYLVKTCNVPIKSMKDCISDILHFIKKYSRYIEEHTISIRENLMQHIGHDIPDNLLASMIGIVKEAVLLDVTPQIRIVNDEVVITGADDYRLNDAYDILQENKAPMKFDALYEQYCARVMTPPLRSLAFKVALHRCQKFKLIGKSGMVALSCWNLDSGSIFQKATALLASYGEPLPLEKVVVSILKDYRCSNRRNVRQCLVGDVKKRFVIFENDFIGLSSKQYSAQYMVAKRTIKDFDTRLNEFGDFLAQHRRMPSVRNGRQESAMYAWYIRIMKSGDDSKISELNRIKDTYITMIA